MDSNVLMPGFGQLLDRHSVWRRQAATRLGQLTAWLDEHQLLDGGASEAAQRLLDQLRLDKVTVAFVGEFSRGKSELINAVFFAEYGRRIMPASAGRTTMCPTELSHDASLPPCLRLLPIETRLQSQALMEWRLAPETWIQVDLDVRDGEQLAGAMEKVAEVKTVNVDKARALGLWNDDASDDNPPLLADGRVEIPRWRHALINMAHPLLRQGLVVLDTPGLNAIGAEPELTVNMVAQAQAVVFVLGADTGVTRSDLLIWRDHLAPAHDSVATRVAVLNKIDVLWDELSSPEQVASQIERQCAETAHALELGRERVLAVSAQKGLLAKVRGKPDLLEASGLLVFEDLLGLQVLQERRDKLQQALQTGIRRVGDDALRVMDVQQRELVEQIEELRGLRGKNQAMVRHVLRRVEQEKKTFDASAFDVLAVRSVHHKLLREVFELLSSKIIRGELAELSATLSTPGVKLRVRRVYADGFSRLRGILKKVVGLLAEIASMLTSSFRKLNTEHGFSLRLPPAPDLARLIADLQTVERSHLQYVSLGQVLQLTRPEFADKLMRALIARVRAVFETGLGEVELWNKSISSQLDVELRERRRAFTRRIEAIDRVQSAAGGLNQRLTELAKLQDELLTREKRLAGELLVLEKLADGMTVAGDTAAPSEAVAA